MSEEDKLQPCLKLNNNPRLVELSPGAFSGLDDLEALQIENLNPLILFSLGSAFSPFKNVRSIKLDDSGLTAIPKDLFTYLTSLHTLSMKANPSVCNLNISARANYTCTCATNYYTLQPLQHGYCLCPKGENAPFGSCIPCAAGTYSDTPNFSRNCTDCQEGNTSNIGSTSSSSCYEDPLLRAERELNEANQRAMIITIASVCGAALFGILGGLRLHQLQRRNLQLTEQVNTGLFRRVNEQHQEIAYLRNWR